jgi:hypothetical protein
LRKTKSIEQESKIARGEKSKRKSKIKSTDRMALVDGLRGEEEKALLRHGLLLLNNGHHFDLAEGDKSGSEAMRSFGTKARVW